MYVKAIAIKNNNESMNSSQIVVPSTLLDLEATTISELAAQKQEFRIFYGSTTSADVVST